MSILEMAVLSMPVKKRKFLQKHKHLLRFVFINNQEMMFNLLFRKATTFTKLQFGAWMCHKYRQNYTNFNYIGEGFVSKTHCHFMLSKSSVILSY